MKRRVGRLPAVPMTARYATTCRVCSGPVQPGDEITKAEQGWAHGPCAATSSDAPQKAAPTRARREMPALDGALEVWTDGACSGNPGPGGWAWAVEDGPFASGESWCVASNESICSSMCAR